MMKSQVQESKQEAVESVEQFASMWKVFVGECADADIVDRPGLSICWNASSFPFWHSIFLTEQTEDAAHLARRVHQASEYMRTRYMRTRYTRTKSEAGLLWICEDFLGEAAQASLPPIAANENLALALTAIGMAGDIFPLACPPHPRLKLKRVTDTRQLMAYADINSEAYGFPLEWGRSGLSGSKLWKTEFHSYLAYEGDRAVSAASAVVNDGVIFLALVATLPEARNQGYGEATVRHALQSAHAATGLTRTVLHATEAGFPVYRRIGYHPTCKFHAYKLLQ